MKLFVIMTFATLSFSSFAQTCYVDMINSYNQVVRTFTAIGDQASCLEGMKECRKAIRLQPQLGGVDCIRGNSPMPTPDAYPHIIMMNETVYNVRNNRYAQVIGQATNGEFLLRFIDNGATGSGWDRDDLAPLRGCDIDVCVGDEVYNTQNKRFARIEGLQMIGQFVLKYTDNNAVGSNWERDDFAVMKGCQAGLCVGTRVYNTVNRRYARIIALQVNNEFVLRYEDNGLVGGGWDVPDLIVVQ